jgi:type I restriction enzyme M protein
VAKRHQSKAGDLQSAFVRLEELVLASSGHDEFQEIYKLTIAKLYDERFSRTPLLRHDGDAAATFAAAAGLLRKAEARWPGVLTGGVLPRLTPEHLSICVAELQRHALLDEGLQALDAFFELVVARTAKGNKGQFFTPRHLVEMCVRMIDPQPGEVIADPACGSAAFLLHAARYIRSANEGIDLGSLQPKLWGFDLDDRAVQIARALMVIAGIGRPNVFCLNALVCQPQRDPRAGAGGRPATTIETAMRTRAGDKGIFDVILTNPPFAGEIQERSTIDGYDLGRSRRRVERDTLFLERCIRLLRPGGRMAIVLPHNKLAGGAFTDLRQWTLRHCHLLAVVGVGRNMFMPHTQQKTGIVVLRKKRSPDERAPKVFFAISEKDGKDARGNPLLAPGQPVTAPLWQRLDHDLDAVVRAYRRQPA